ncbi:hypothetical protein ACJX0J_032884, partial [Zea mays]
WARSSARSPVASSAWPRRRACCAARASAASRARWCPWRSSSRCGAPTSRQSGASSTCSMSSGACSPAALCARRWTPPCSAPSRARCVRARHTVTESPQTLLSSMAARPRRFLQMSAADTPALHADHADIFDTGGTNGMARVAMDALPVVRFTERSNVDASGELIACSVCLQ